MSDASITALEETVTSKASAAIKYFVEVTQELENLTTGLNAAADASQRTGRAFLRVNMTTADVSELSGHRSTKLASLIGKAVMLVNSVQPGELSVEITYDSPTIEKKDLRWQFPYEGSTSASQLAGKIVREMVAPTNGKLE